MKTKMTQNNYLTLQIIPKFNKSSNGLTDYYNRNAKKIKTTQDKVKKH